MSSLKYGSNFQDIKAYQFVSTNINIFFSQTQKGIFHTHKEEFLIERLL